MPDDNYEEVIENDALAAREVVEREIEEHRRRAAYTKSVFHAQTDRDTLNSTRSLYDSDVVYIQQHDIAKVQPTAVPLNVFFEIDDAEEEGGWTWPPDEFDLIHLRNMAGAFSDWDHIYSEAYIHLKPGGWIEIMDFDDHKAFLTFFDEDSPMPALIHDVGEAARILGRPRGVAHLEPERLRKSGFVDVEVKEVGIPMGPWPDDKTQRTIGKLWLVSMLTSLEAYTLRLLTQALGWDEEEVRRKCMDCSEDMRKVSMDVERARGLKTMARVLVGRKPRGEGDVGDGDGESVVTETQTRMVTGT
ncbi:hypothetical protein DID88_008213 [Monilinia fructigena]|uniref:Methyltransferase type 11 domain-containing protein n=1 Tax=Monilinia fructigena TaxID=38457 RepID=A0A395J5P6_9HELO|nr:hypothetical protein DID88_008213 [Monilinia fructigena]